MNKLLLLCILSFLISCKKEKENGRINVKINYVSSTSVNQTVSYSETVVKLYKNNALLDTKEYEENEANVSFGVYEYGENYSVTCSAKKSTTTVSGSISTTNTETVSTSQNFHLASEDCTVEVSLQ
jgi:hypothetical protein